MVHNIWETIPIMHTAQRRFVVTSFQSSESLTLAEGRTLLPLLALVCFGSRYLRVGVRIVALSRQRSAQNDSHEDALTV